MPDQLNKQTLINLLIDSPLREPIKINLIDIVNNTSDPDLPKVFPTITKELEIFQKATERRMKLADETISKLGGSAAPSAPSAPTPPAPALHIESDSSREMTPGAQQPGSPPMDLPPLPPTQTANQPLLPLSVPPLDLPPLPTPLPLHTENDSSREMTPGVKQPGSPTPTPLGGIPQTPQGDEAALAEIQKELDSLKQGVAEDAKPPAAPTHPPQA
ncbi:MAG: hypothetical protein ABII21_02195 [bacterium]